MNYTIFVTKCFSSAGSSIIESGGVGGVGGGGGPAAELSKFTELV